MRAAGCIHLIEGSVQPARTEVRGVGDLLRQAEVSYLLITLGALWPGDEGETLVIVEPIAADLDLDEVEVAAECRRRRLRRRRRRAAARQRRVLAGSAARRRDDHGGGRADRRELWARIEVELDAARRWTAARQPEGLAVLRMP